MLFRSELRCLIGRKSSAARAASSASCGLPNLAMHTGQNWASTRVAPFSNCSLHLKQFQLTVTVVPAIFGTLHRVATNRRR